MHSEFIILILSIYWVSFSSALNCSTKPFDCGSIYYIAYPFWGGDRPSECGRKGFQLVCDRNTPTLTISSLSYQVQKLDFSTNTLTVARQDLQDSSSCPDPLRNTTIDWKLFKYPPKSTDRNLTLYFHCTGDQIRPNAFSCGNQSSNIFKIDDASSGPGTGITCDNNIYVPINNKDAESLENPTVSSINILRSALTAGFSIQWLSDSLQSTQPFCNAKVYSSCIPAVHYNRPCTYTTCYRSDPEEGKGPSPAPVIKVPVPSPSPVHIQDSIAAPVSTPASSSAQPMPAGNGMPHVQSTGYPLTSHNDGHVNNGKNRAKEIVLVVPLTVAAIIMVSISIHCFLKRRRSLTAPNQERKHDVEKLLLQNGSLTPKRYKYSEIKKITKSLSDELGQGGYGCVYKGMLPDGRLVAVKVLNETTDSNGEEFINEVASISRTSHVNIVTLLGFCYEGNRRALVYEFMPNSSLDKFLNNNQSDLEMLFKIAVGTAKGLEYLHTGCTTRIVHFDIKPQNILLDQDLCPKISDFGLAKLYKNKQSILSVLGARGTAGYIAPEVFSRNFGGVSHKSDVYSYGMMLLEMAGATKATQVQAIQSNENYFPDKIYEQVMSTDVDDMMMEGEEETRKKMVVVGFWCIQTIPSNRPSISKVVEMLEGSFQSIQIPPKPFLFSPSLPRHEISSSETQNSAQD